MIYVYTHIYIGPCNGRPPKRRDRAARSLESRAAPLGRGDDTIGNPRLLAKKTPATKR